MAVKLSSLRRNDSEAEWIAYPDMPGVELLVASFHKPAYKTAQQALLQKLNRRYGRKPVPSEVTHEEFGKLYAKHILQGWRGFDEPYTPERAEEILCDQEFRELQTAVEWCANQRAEVEIDQIEDTEKNSQGGSDTN